MTSVEVNWDWLTGESISSGTSCSRIGHCYHEGTTWDTFYCCRCGKYKRNDLGNIGPIANLVVERVNDR